MFFFSSRRRHTRLQGDWSSDVCSSDLVDGRVEDAEAARARREDGLEADGTIGVAELVRRRGDLGRAVDAAEVGTEIGRASCREREEGPRAAAVVEREGEVECRTSSRGR